MEWKRKDGWSEVCTERRIAKGGVSVHRLYFLHALVSFTCMLVGMPLDANAEPSLHDLRESEDPVLARAIEVHLRYAPPEQADQEEAARLFLEFVRSNPDSEYVPLIMTELARSYGSLVTPEHEKSGARRDRLKSLEYFRRAIEAYPPGRIGPTLRAAKVNVAALQPRATESAREYVEFLEWTESLTSDEVASRLWLSQKQQRLIATGEWQLSESVEGFLRQTRKYKEVSETNLLAAIHSVEDDAEKIAILHEVASRLPNTDAGRRAALKLNERGLSAAETSRPTASDRDSDPVPPEPSHSTDTQLPTPAVPGPITIDERHSGLLLLGGAVVLAIIAAVVIKWFRKKNVSQEIK